MNEIIGAEEKPQQMSIYFGTTVENFLTCFEIDEDGSMWFNKARETRHVEPHSIQFSLGLTAGILIAIDRSIELSHSPLVIEGLLNRGENLDKLELEENTRFPVTKVWIPTLSNNWKTPPERPLVEIEQLFKPVDPTELSSQVFTN